MAAVITLATELVIPDPFEEADHPTDRTGNEHSIQRPQGGAEVYSRRCSSVIASACSKRGRTLS